MSLVAVDIGNSRIKLGQFDTQKNAVGLPLPSRVLALRTQDWDATALVEWSAYVPPAAAWWIASVNRPAAARLVEWIQTGAPGKKLSRNPAQQVRMLMAADFPISVAIPQPERVGIDRLAGAVAANRLRDPKRPAIVIGVGTAITVDQLSAEGAFCGGAILPGIGTSARALHQFTDLLPHLPLEELEEPPPALGTSTTESLHSGLYWGAVGAMRELITRLSESLPQRPEVFLTGGAARSVAATLGPEVRHVEHLVLSGIALAAPPAA